MNSPPPLSHDPLKVTFLLFEIKARSLEIREVEILYLLLSCKTQLPQCVRAADSRLHGDTHVFSLTWWGTCSRRDARLRPSRQWEA